MKLAALGAVTVVIGLWLGISGLVGIGLYWVVLGPVVRRHQGRLRASMSDEGEAKPVVDRRTFALGSLIWALIGVPSLVVGILQIGIAAEDASWRWLPIVVGGTATAVGVLAAALFVLGSAVSAGPGAGNAATPATIWIRAVRETGTFINERPRLEFELQVEPDASSGLDPYDVTKKATVPYTAIGALRVGDGFRARVAGPQDATAMEILWSEPVSAPGSGSAATSGDVAGRLAALDQLRAAGSVDDEEYAEQRRRILDAL
ncbi:SHOCT domain-containing protein [Aeromicrobium sp. Leaf350]|uniref:SHOCT domain-containing protein n=1 Tax=Aeromicrobium sp. Leaf350 TaxID=2876565 RepID=UPI001E45B062|nr:SHOCT domain-containing protein [Aeromicrobium sp. Leaf350]